MKFAEQIEAHPNKEAALLKKGRKKTVDKAKTKTGKLRTKRENGRHRCAYLKNGRSGRGGRRERGGIR